MGGALSYIFKPLITSNITARVSPWVGGAKLAGYLGALGLVAKTNFFRSPDDLINGLHKSGAFLGELLGGASFSQASRIFSDEVYYHECERDRDFGSLYGWRDYLRPVVSGLMIVTGLGVTWHEMGRWFQTPKAGTEAYTKFVAEHGTGASAKRRAIGLGTLFSLYLGARAIADCWGNARGRDSKEGTCPSNPVNFDLQDFNLNIFSSEWAMMAFLSVAHGRAGTLAGNATDVLYHKIGGLAHRRQWWLRKDFHPTTDYTKVRAEAIAMPAEVKAGLKAGMVKGPLAWKIGIGVVALAAIGWGILSAIRIAKKESCNPTIDSIFVGLGAVAAYASAAVMFSPQASAARKKFDTAATITRNIFRAPRLSHLLLFTMVGVITTTSINFVLRYIQGFRNIDYYIQNGLRSIYGPMPNRIFGNVWSSLSDAPFTRLEYIMPGQFAFYQTVEVLTQPKETLSQAYLQLAQQYRLEGEPEDILDYRQRLVQKESDLVAILGRKRISLAELETYYLARQRDKKRGTEEAKRLPIHKTVREEPLAEQYVNILGIKDEFSLTGC